MGEARKLALGIYAALAGAAGACGLFPDLSLIEARDSGPEDGGSDATLDGPSSDGGGDGPSDAPPDALATSCPDAGRGPTMIAVDDHTCIDSTEVTVGEYRAFFAGVDAGALAPIPACTWSTDFTPTGGMPSASKNAFPITHVNWCQAYAFCSWAGKSLCGTPDGGDVPFGSYGDPAKSVWMNACSAGGARSYPYGPTYEAGACNLVVGDATAPIAPVASFPGCVGSLPGLYDMIGNISEWELACQPSTSGDASLDLCRRRGATADDPANPSTATCDFDETDTRNHESSTCGFRCCAVLP